MWQNRTIARMVFFILLRHKNVVRPHKLEQMLSIDVFYFRTSNTESLFRLFVCPFVRDLLCSGISTGLDFDLVPARTAISVTLGTLLQILHVGQSDIDIVTIYKYRLRADAFTADRCKRLSLLFLRV